MAKYEFTPTKNPNIFEYEIKKGKRYRVRIGFTINGKYDEFDKMGIKTLAEAKSILREAEENIEKEEIGYINNKKTTVKEYYSIFRADKIETKEWSDTSIVGYDSNFINHILPIFGNIPLIKLDRVNYQKFINKKLHDDNRSVSSVKTMDNHFMAMVNHAVTLGAIERNRLKKIKISRADYKPKKKNLSLEEYGIFIDAAENKLTDKIKFCMVYLTTFGMRRGEIMGLTSKNISFRESDGRALINIIKTRTQANPNGKGTKTPSSERIIPVDDKGTQLLKFVMNEASEIKKDYGEILHQDDFIFINQRTNEPYNVSYINSLMKSISIQCGVKANPHMMRHTFATQTRLNGADVRSVADYLGHKSEKMTDHYTHATAEGMDNVVNIANSRLH